MVDKCNKIADQQEIKLRSTYTRANKRLHRERYNGTHPKGVQQANKVLMRLKTIANAQLRDLERKMCEDQQAFYGKDLALFKRAVNQQKNDKHKVN